MYIDWQARTYFIPWKTKKFPLQKDRRLTIVSLGLLRVYRNRLFGHPLEQYRAQNCHTTEESIPPNISQKELLTLPSLLPTPYAACSEYNYALCV